MGEGKREGEEEQREGREERRERERESELLVSIDCNPSTDVDSILRKRIYYSLTF